MQVVAMKCSNCKCDGHTKRSCKAAKQLNVKPKQVNIQMNWIGWTNKSAAIPFKTTIKGVGDGEQKTAAELGTNIQGQNSNYDMKVIIDGKERLCDVKKLDNGTFNTCVKGRDALRPIKNTITDLLNIFNTVRSSPILTSDEKNTLKQFEEVSPDELCVSNIKKINDACLMLHKKQELIRTTLPKVCPFKNMKGDTIEMPLDKYYSICLILNQPLSSEFESHKDNLVFLTDISHKYIANPKLFNESLDGLVSLFAELKLIFVDETKGYCIWNDMDCIKFERITRGNPRFRIVPKAHPEK